jgi:hypothetical protein
VRLFAGHKPAFCVKCQHAGTAHPDEQPHIGVAAAATDLRLWGPGSGFLP